MKKHKYSNMSKSGESVISANLPSLTKETLKGTNSINTKKLRFPAQSVEMFNEQGISTNTS